jgi:hypothetical protein
VAFPLCQRNFGVQKAHTNRTTFTFYVTLLHQRYIKLDTTSCDMSWWSVATGFHSTLNNILWKLIQIISIQHMELIYVKRQRNRQNDIITDGNPRCWWNVCGLTSGSSFIEENDKAIGSSSSFIRTTSPTIFIGMTCISLGFFTWYLWRNFFYTHHRHTDVGYSISWCLFVWDFSMNVLLQLSQAYSRWPVCISICSFISDFCFFTHITGYVWWPLCISICVFIWDFWLNVFWHTSQAYGPWLQCISWCFVKLLLILKVLLHTPQAYVRRPVCISICVFIWCFKMNVFLHTSQAMYDGRYV